MIYLANIVMCNYRKQMDAIGIDRYRKQMEG